jgi:hypothetical protein
MADITGANAQFTLAISGLFNAPLPLQGFAADDVFDTDAIESTETLMGVDGILSGGMVNVPVKQTVALQADSPSMFLFDQWWATQRANQMVLFAQGVVVLTSLGTKWALTNGLLTSYKPIPDTKKLLQPRRFGLTWESVSPALT